MECVVQSLKAYDFKNDSGERVQGAKLSYFSLSPVAQEGLEGNPPLQATVDTNIVTNLVKVPGLYNFDFDMKPGRNNKPELVLSKATFISEVDFKKCISK